jgi:hypothetical protein
MYLMRNRTAKRGRAQTGAAHIWDGADTLCTMYSTGGLKPSRYRVSDTAEGRSLCLMGQLAGGDLDNRFRTALARDKD